MAKSINIVLVRHGETEDNVNRLIQGHRDSKLSDTGRLQSQIVGERLANEKFTRAYTSSLSRATETTEIILKQSKFPAPHMIADKRLRERGFGVLEGLHASHALEAAKAQGIHPRDLVPSGAETQADVQERMVDFLQVLFDLYDSPEDENVLIVTHGGWLQSLMVYLQSHPNLFKLVNFQKKNGLTISGNTGVTKLQLHAHSKNEPHQITFFSMYDISHLQTTFSVPSEFVYLKNTTTDDGI